MANVIEIEKRSIRENECILGPNLILITEKPLPTDKVEVFDSPEASYYLSRCFKSKFKSANTHITFVKDTSDLAFARGIFFNILGKYYSQETLDVNKLIVAFIGQEAFNAFMEDYNSQIDTNFIKLFVNEETKTLEVIANFIKASNISIPYVILPSLSSPKNEVDRIPHLLDKVPFPDYDSDSIYCTAEEFGQKLNLIKELYEEGSLKYFKLDIKFNANTKKIKYVRLYDRYSGKVSLFDFTLEEFAPEERTKLANIIKETLITVPVHGENIQEAVKLFSYRDKIKVLSQEDLDEQPLNRSSFVFTGDEKHPDGSYSEWYHKWYTEVYTPYLAGNKSIKGAEAKCYKDHHKYEWIYDIEVFKYDWLFVAKSVDGKNKIVCWNDAEALIDWVGNKILIGFNNAAYDNPVITHAMSYPYLVNQNKDIKQFSDALIFDEQDRNSFPEIKKDLKGNPIKDIPSFLSWDISFHMPFDVRRNSLKKLTMSVLDRRNYDSAVSFDIQRPLTKLEREEVERYCEMDVDNTRDLFLPDPEDIKKKAEDPKHKTREYAQESYDIRWNLIIEYKMKAKTLINKAASFAGKLLCGEEAKPNPSNTFKMVDGKRQYYKIPDMAYKELAGTTLLQFYIDNQSNPNYITEKFEYHMGGEDEGHLYQFGFGGLHQALLNYGSTNLINMDVASLYPSLLVNYGLMSRGAEKNPASYEEVYHTRLQAKKEGKTLLNLGLKLILNGSIGAFLSGFNPLFDTWANSTICVHGQLLLFILAKRLFDVGFNIVQVNTDGIMIEKNGDADYMSICDEWQKQTKLVLEFDDIAVLQQNNVNNYYCKFTNGKVKSKGFYLSNEKFGKATSKILCNLVTQKPPLEGTTPKDYVIYKRHGVGEIYDAITRTKLDGRSLAFVVGYPEDKRTQAYYSRSRNERKVVRKDEKGKPVLDENGNQVFDTVNSESKISGFTDNMLLVDDVNTLTMEEINTSEYINFARNLLDRVEDFGPYFDEGFVKVEEPAFLQSLNPFKDNTDKYATNAGVVCQNLLFECDYASKEEQEEMIEAAKNSLYRVTWSGNRSYHCIVRLSKPVTVMVYKKLWAHLRNKLGFYGADEQCAIPAKYTRTPGQINPKTGNEQKLYSFDKNIIDLDTLLDELPRLKEEVKKPAVYKGKITIEALEKHIKKLDWSEGNRFNATQKLSPALISQVSIEELLKMIPIKLEKNQIAVIRSKRYYWEKQQREAELEKRLLEEQKQTESELNAQETN